ncbi:Na+/H+ antiporter [Kocuria sp.]|uniref:Na+/H+ antiporter n=1 Tax=Kocuria sp. TaxID=1871328 RepID=UPI0026DC049C|nr:Na+/H+ antiporter [Kocuria sp.]MDO4919839.1 Na+/H+ antiporter [Kocuria sp.]
MRVAEPIILLALGLLLALVPIFHSLELPPDMVLVIFLPVLLFWEALNSSVRSLRIFIRGILLTSTVLVVVTAAAVAAVAHAMGLDWPEAWVLGAAVAPTDATVVAAMGRLLPNRTLAVLRSESLLNDGTALVVFAVSLAAASNAKHVTTGEVALDFLISIGGALGAGLLTAFAAFWVQQRLREPLHYNMVLVLVPFVAYLLGEAVHASGVLAVVTAGLYLARVSPRHIDARRRAPAQGFWNISTFLLNGALFVLVGVQLPSVVQGLHTVQIATAILLGLALLVTLFVVRFGFLVVSAYLIRALDRRPQQRKLRVSNRARLVSAMCGFRGAVSLAMALSVPQGLASRDVIVFATAVAVFGTIVIQGLALPAVVRWAKLPKDDSAAEETKQAEVAGYRAALNALPELARANEIHDDVAERVRMELKGNLAAAGESQDGEAEASENAERYAQLRLALIDVRRRAVVSLRDQGKIDDEVLLDMQPRLDVEELRWVRE